MLSEEYVENADLDEHAAWYENDLELAAELGKTLLERNKEVETQLRLAQAGQAEHENEIDLLTKQLDVLRNVNDSRMRIYEEVDRNLQEAEKANERLKQEAKTDKEKIKTLQDTVESLDSKVDELQNRIEEIKFDERQRQKREKRTWSVPSLTEVSSMRDFRGNFDYLGFPSVFDPTAGKGHRKQSTKELMDKKKVKDLKETLRAVRVELGIEQRKRVEMEADIVYLEQDNRVLQEKVDFLQRDQESPTKQSPVSPTERAKASQSPFRSNRKRGQFSETSSVADQSEMLEHDIDEIPRGQLVRLKNGGSAYGSRESLNMIGLELDDTTAMVEKCSDILVSSMCTGEDESSEDLLETETEGINKCGDTSLLGELEEQYRRLVMKYEKLVEAKSKRSPARDMSTQDNIPQTSDVTVAVTEPEASGDSSGVVMRQKKDPGREAPSQWRSSLNLDLRSPINPVEGHFEKGPPEYKKLFKEIFETLRRSTVFDDDDINVLQQDQAEN